jgi:processing peptidase subunit alpha
MLRHVSKRSISSATRITKLANGIRVASLPSPGSHFQTLGVFIDAGTKYETASTAGFTHILDRMAFKSTKSYKSEDLVKEIEGLGGNIQAVSGKIALFNY